MFNLDSAIEAVATLKTIDEANELLGQATRQAGFSAYCFVRSVPAKVGPDALPFLMQTVRQDWSQHYTSHAFYDHDPVVNACRGRNLPLAWTLDECSHDRLTPAEREVLKVASDFGINRGLMVPVHSAGGEMSLLTAYFDGSERAFHETVAQTRHALHLLAIHAHDAIAHNLLAAARHDCGLTRREIECLKWSSQGKTAWETSQILRISERTVNFHLSNSMHKLGVHSKTHAVAKLSTLGVSL